MDCTSSTEEENRQLKAQVEDLLKELENKENQVILSAQFGKQLLDNNGELHRQLEEIQECNLTQIEELRQENYSLKMKIEADYLARDNFSIELDTMKTKLQDDAKLEIDNINSNYCKKIEELGAEIESLQTEVDKKTLIAEQLQEKCLKQDEMLADAHKYSKQLQNMDILETAVEELKEECVLMRFNNDELQIKLTDMSDEKQQILFDKQNLTQKLEIIKENLEERSTQAKIWCDALQNSRQQISELQMEVSALKAEVLNHSHKDKGNSLFGEVEDKRLELQQKYTTVSTKYESLQKTHQIVKRQLHQYKSQILPMLQMAGNQADSSKMKRVEAALSHSQSEIQKLNIKIRDLRRENQDQSSSTRLESLHDVVINSKDKKDYVTILQNEITCLKETISDLHGKSELTSLKLLAETDKRRETESLLHSSEIKKEKLEHEIVRLRLKLEDLTIKLQQLDAKNNEQAVKNCNTKRETKKSIWQDSDIFSKKNKSLQLTHVRKHDNDVVKKSLPESQHESNCIEANNTTTCDKKFFEQEIITSNSSTPGLKDVIATKVKPVGRVLPLKEESQMNKTTENKENQSITDNPQNCVEVKTTISDKDDGPENDEPALCNVEISMLGNASNDQKQCEEIQRTCDKQKSKRREVQRDRVIHVKKNVVTQNECKQQ